MGKPGAKKNDQIVSATPGDVHIIMIPSPGGPVPTPIPHPCASMINDKVAEAVKVMGQPGAVKGSKSKHTPPHIPMGPGPFQKPPKNEGEIITGSANVFYEGKEAAMLGDTGQMCSDPSDTPVGKVMGTAAMVMVGGGGSGGDAERAAASAAAMKAAAAACHKWINANMPPGADREQAHRDLCTATGHPIDVATGKLFTRSIDLELPGRIPFAFVRNYSSARPERGLFGWGWRHSYQIELVVNSEFVGHRDANGRFLAFAPINVGDSSTNLTGGLILRRTPEAFLVENAAGIIQRFPATSNGDSLIPLSAIEDSFGNRIEFTYENQRLAYIRDAAGRKLRLDYDEQSRIKGLLLQNPASFQFELIRSFHYNEDNELVQVQDCVNNSLRYDYANHLLVRETDRNGFSFYFRYDGDGWCRETWGDGGLLYRAIDYDRKKRCTRVCDSEGNYTLYRWSENGLVEEEIDPLGERWSFQYDDFQHRISATDPLGKSWAYEYDPAGRLLCRTDPSGNAVTVEYDKMGRRTGYVDGKGRAWPMRYDASGNVVALLDPEANTVGIEWSSKGDLIASVDEAGRRTCYLYDEAGNMVERRTKRGLLISRAYDSKGQLLQETDALGPRVRLEYDVLGRVKTEVWRDRGKILYERDAEGNVTKVIDAFGVATSFEYGRFNKVLKQVCDGGGTIPAQTSQEYDSENRLKAVVYPGGRRAEYGYDAAGRIRWKLCVDGRKLVYSRNAAGFVTEVHDAAGLIASYQHDALGRITRQETADGEVTSFEYDPCGQLVKAINESGEVQIQYDSCARVTAESGPYGAIEKELDALGRLAKWSLGEDLICTVTREEGSETFATGAGSVRADYDLYGRLQSLAYSHGAIEKFSYGSSRRPEAVVLNGAETRYEYDAGGCVLAIAISNGQKQWFERDVQRRLVAATRNGSGPARTVRFHYDSQGNRSRGDEAFAFAFGNRLAGTQKATLKYDLRGRIVERHERDGLNTEYRYSADGYLKEVLRGQDRTCFRYDPLGRRISKIFNGKETRYSWDGTRLAHEWRPNGEQRNYIYRPNSHIPLMCHRRQDDGPWEVFFFHNDHRGCPERLTDSAGRQVWCAEIGPFGDIENEEGDWEQPLGLPGQYRDVETGLIYNYRRYFDAQLTIFITPDPMGHVAGDQLYAYSADPITKVDPLGLSDADYDSTKMTPHRIVTINGVRYVEFDAADAWTNGNNVNVGGSGRGPDGSPDTLARIDKDGRVIVFEGRHRAIVSAVDDPIPEDRGGIPGKPGHLRYELSDTEGEPGDAAHRLSNLAADPKQLAAARSGHPSVRTT